VLADDNDFSLSSGNSTELIRMFLAERSRRLWTGLDGAVMTFESSQKSKLVFTSRNRILMLHYEQYKGNDVSTTVPDFFLQDMVCSLTVKYFTKLKWMHMCNNVTVSIM
jgi:hypothetical protein